MTRFTRPTARLSLTALEDRTVPANGITSTFANGVLAILGTANADTFTVSQTSSTVTVSTSNSAGTATFTAPTAQVKEIQVRGQAGNDSITFNSTVSIRGTMYGGDGNDTITGGAGADTEYGEGGDDVLYGMGGNDTLDGGAGSDKLFGGDGSDKLYGGDGNDWLEAGSAAEFADGGGGTNWNAHVWAVNGATAGDVNQTGVGDCIFLSSVSAAAQQGVNLASRITYQGNYTYAVSLYDTKTKVWVGEKVKFDGTMTTYNGYLMDPKPSTGGESWVILFQRAYLQHFYNISPTNGAALWGFGGEYNANQAEAALTGRTATTSAVPTSAATLQTALSQGKVVTAATFQGQGGHSYSVLKVYQVDGEWRIDVRNPWGTDRNPNNLTSLNDTNPNDGVITLKYADFAKAYAQVTVG